MSLYAPRNDGLQHTSQLWKKRMRMLHRWSMQSTVRCLGIEFDDAIEIAEKVDI
ncbi:MAG: hypothetical protein J0H36_06315 [Hyphomicrobium denitrificans]|nr:hypothetical protein [Hyphomicrobium denitrificans]